MSCGSEQPGAESNVLILLQILLNLRIVEMTKKECGLSISLRFRRNFFLRLFPAAERFLMPVAGRIRIEIFVPGKDGLVPKLHFFINNCQVKQRDFFLLLIKFFSKKFSEQFQAFAQIHRRFGVSTLIVNVSLEIGYS